MKTLTSVEAKTNFGAVLDSIEGGEEIVITRNGREVARMLPASRPRMSREEAVKRLAAFASDHKLTLGKLDLRKLRDEGRKR